MINHINSDLDELKNSISLIAVSGGRDSMVLWHIFDQLQLPYIVAHINYGLRGAESNSETELVEQTAKLRKCKLYIHKPIKPIETNIQTWARSERYAFFNKLRIEHGAHRIVTAHHLQDQWEHLFIYLHRNNIHTAFRGIVSNINQIYRPLLYLSNSWMDEYVQSNQIEYKQDSSNQKTDYLRNKIRHWLLPFFPLDMDWQQLQQVNLDAQYMEQILARKFQKNCLYHSSQLWILPLQNLQNTLTIQFALRNLGIHSRQFQQVQSMQSGSTIQIASGKLYRTQKHIVYHSQLPIKPESIHTSQTVCEFEFGIFTISIVNPEQIQLTIKSCSPLKSISTSIGTQKIKEILINKKVPFYLREYVPAIVWQENLLCLSNIVNSTNYKALQQNGLEINCKVIHPYSLLF